MSDIVKQNQLLKEYASSLQKENEARNIERSTLFHEIQRMGTQIDRLNNIISKYNSKNNNNSNLNERQIKALKDSNSTLLKEMQIIKSKISQLSSQIKTKQSLISMLTQEKQSLVSQIMQLKELQIKYSQSSNKITFLYSQINKYKQIKTQIAIYQQNTIALNQKILCLQERLKDVENRYSQQIYIYQEKINKLQKQNEQSKLNNNASIEISRLTNIKTNLQATNKRLTSKIEWLQTNNNQQQKLNLQIKLRDFQGELAQAYKYIEELKNNQISYDNLQESRNAKSKQIITLQNMIQSLKGNKIYLQKNIKEKEQIISHLQSQVYNFTNIQQNNHQLQGENHQLRSIKLQLQKQISLLTLNNHNVEQQMNKFFHKQKTYISEMNSLRQERERLLKELDTQSYSLDQAQNEVKLYKSKVTQYNINRNNQSHYRNIPQRDYHRQNDNENLRLIVTRLQQQIQQLKASQFKSQIFQDNIYKNHQSLSNINIKSQISRQSRSPTAGVLINNTTDKNDYNKRKWENLQRKINVLRNQNETLKKTLFD